jgi:hypothetical protein
MRYMIVIPRAAFNRKKNVFTSKLDLKFKVEASKMVHLEHSYMVLTVGHIRKEIRNTGKVLKCGAGEG